MLRVKDFELMMTLGIKALQARVEVDSIEVGAGHA